MTPGAPPPSLAYARGVAAGRWLDDAAQRAVLPSLDRLHAQLQPAARRWWPFAASARTRVRGLYLWGAVGRGKTFLTDLLLESLPPGIAVRLHFHRFMGRVHARLAQLQGRSDPLRDVAAEFATQARLVCLDEIFVSDIGDAMILGGLLQHMFDARLTLVTTSNIEPHSLYRDGLQRARFLPAIDLLQAHCEVRELASPHDHRLRALREAGVYFHPADARAERALAAAFERIAHGTRTHETTIRINDRDIPLRRRADGVAWFDFAALCAGPRSVADYIELAQTFNTLLVSGVPRLDASNEDAARRFIDLVDELYDRGVKLLLSAALPIEALYGGERLQAEFARTRSRLVQMGGSEYLAAAHRH